MENFTLDDNVYFLLLLGMLAVGAHAYSLFNQPIERPGTAARWRFLSTIPIELATTQPRFRLGLVFYMVVFELIYLVLSSSSSLLLMTYQMSGRQDLTGALSESVAPSGTVPILASTAIILFTQIRPVSHVELILRRFAHRMARVPDGLKLVKQRASDYLRHAKLPETVFSTELARIDGLVDPLIGERLKHSQINIGWLFEHSLGARGSMAWDEEGSEELIQLFKPIKFEVMQLRSDLLDATRPASIGAAKPENTKSNAQAPGPWQELLNRSLHLEERLTLLLCLLIINQPEINTNDEIELTQLIEHTRKRERSEVSDIAIKSCIFGVLVSVLALFFFESNWQNVKSNLRDSPHTHKAPFGNYLDARVDSNSDNATRYPLDGLTTAEYEQLTIRSSISVNLTEAFDETLWAGITFMCAAFIALSMNTPHVQLWKSYDQVPESEPVTSSAHYSLIAIAALVTAATALFIYMFITMALLPALHHNIDVLSFEIMSPFASMIPSIMRFSLGGAVCAIFIIWLDGYFASRQVRERNKPVESKENKKSSVSQNALARTITALLRIMKSQWLACFSAAAFIALLFIATSVATEQSIEIVDGANRFIVAFISFFSFLAVLAMVMQRHPHRYSSASSSTSKSGGSGHEQPGPSLGLENDQTSNRAKDRKNKVDS